MHLQVGKVSELTVHEAIRIHLSYTGMCNTVSATLASMIYLGLVCIRTSLLPTNNIHHYTCLPTLTSHSVPGHLVF